MSPDLHDEVVRLRTRVNERLGELVPPEDTPPEQLHRALRYSLVAPGKRIRPLMTILTATRLGADAETCLDPACALEIVHTASLIIDDMPFMDDATTRRGKPAHHTVFGEDLAALASLELLSRAYGVMARARGLDDRLRLELIRLLSRHHRKRGRHRRPAEGPALRRPAPGPGRAEGDVHPEDRHALRRRRRRSAPASPGCRWPGSSPSGSSR